MLCPRCGCIEDKVLDSRQSKDGTIIRRRRVCLGCDHRFTTYEQIERADLRVRKRDGRVEPFDRQKLVTGITKACEKRPIDTETIDAIVEELTQHLQAKHGREISSKEIGIEVMERLHALDEVAYVRYASVYRQFQDVGEFIDEIRSMERKPKLNRLQPDLFVAQREPTPTPVPKRP
jgi:transcriptional repressor NrdR